MHKHRENITAKGSPKQRKDLCYGEYQLLGCSFCSRLLMLFSLKSKISLIWLIIPDIREFFGKPFYRPYEPIVFWLSPHERAFVRHV